MLFNNPLFFVFLAIVLLLLVFGNQKYKKLLLLVSSYTFYGFWDWRFLSLIAISTLIDFIVGKTLDDTNDSKKRKSLLLISIIANLGILGFFKYFNFFIDSFNSLLSNLDIATSTASLNIILPVGISFYTFQTMSYTFDIYRKEIKPTKSLLDFSNFVAFFPQLVAGPIERAKHLIPQLEKFNGLDFKGFKEGFVLIFMGLIRKVLISDNIAGLTDNYFSNYKELDSIYLLLGLLLFSFQIYFDFSGYSSIARGLSKLFGIDLMINFNQPYFSISFSEFWRRWHISLSTWLRDYLYIPLGGNRKGEVRTYINLSLTMLLGGLWHGASWNFVLWGALHGLYLIINRLFFEHKFKDKNGFGSIGSIFRMIFVYWLVLLTWLPFRAKDFTTTYDYFIRMHSFVGEIHSDAIMIILLLFILLFLIDYPAYKQKTHLFLLTYPKWLQIAVYLIGIIAIVLTMLLYQNTVRPFIYFQF